MKQIKSLAIIMGLFLCTVSVPVQAVGVWKACTNDAENVDTAICADKSEGTGFVTLLINFFLSVLGIVAVFMIIHSGMKYVTSRGDAEQIKSAKNTLLYAIVGLIVAMLAFVIVNYVTGIFTQTGTAPPTARSNIENILNQRSVI